MSTYRYKAQGPDISKLAAQLPDVPTLGSYGPGVYVDIVVASTSLADLIRCLHWVGLTILQTQ
jgi:hypothetical protein